MDQSMNHVAVIINNTTIHITSVIQFPAVSAPLSVFLLDV